MKSALKKIPGVYSAWQVIRGTATLPKRVSDLERNLRNYRWETIDLAADYLVGAQVDGDYCEFGVYNGDTFGHMVRYHEIFPDMRFFALDSFEGLPEPTGIDNEQGYTSNFHKGEFACSEEQFMRNLKKKKLPTDRVTTVKGWFSDSLNDALVKKHSLNKIACAWVDCDLYESTVPVLEFLTDKLSVGSLMIFDDWKVYRNLPDRGQQKACAEWLEKNPGLELRDLFDFSHHGKVFTVSKVPS